VMAVERAGASNIARRVTGEWNNRVRERSNIKGERERGNISTKANWRSMRPEAQSVLWQWSKRGERATSKGGRVRTTSAEERTNTEGLAMGWAVQQDATLGTLTQ